MSDVCATCPHAVIDHGEALGCMSCTCVDPGLPAATPEPDPEPEPSADEAEDAEDSEAE